MSRRGRPAQASGSERSRSESRPLASDQSPVVSSGSKPPPDLVDGPRHRGHGRDAEPLVDLGPAGVVDAGHHMGDLVGLPGDAHGQDVGVVTARDGGQRTGLVGPRLLEVVAVEARADDAGAVPVLQAAERPGRPVEDGDRVALLAQQDGQARANPATPDDDDVHGPQCNTPAEGRAKAVQVGHRIASTLWRWPPRRRRPRRPRTTPRRAYGRQHPRRHDAAARAGRGGDPRVAPLPAEESPARPAARHRAAGLGAPEPSRSPSASCRPTAFRLRPTAPSRC